MEETKTSEVLREVLEKFQVPRGGSVFQRFLFFAWFYHSKYSGSGFWHWAENCKNNLARKKKPEIFGIARRGVPFSFG